MKLRATQQKFILHWGEMGTRWGINRSVAQIHALLFISPKPLNAEEIAETLEIARSNVSSSLRELQGWRILRLTHVLGDKRDYFDSVKDVWELFRIIGDERKRREIDPTLALLNECLADVSKEKDSYTQQRLSELHDFLQTTTTWYDKMAKLPTATLRKLLSAGDRVLKMIGG